MADKEAKVIHSTIVTIVSVCRRDNGSSSTAGGISISSFAPIRKRIVK
jgi:hypothetical protein